jgi:glycosyltransferase involved in cell wall biosynthesis
MKVLHITYSFTPDPIGGTEVYVGDLCRRLESLGVASVIAAPADRSQVYEVDGLRVHRFPFRPRPDDLEALYGAGDAPAADAFDAVLIEEQPDLVHQHALTPACSGALIDRARRRGVPVIFTYHTPTVSCQRGTLLRWGSEVCEGQLEFRQCAACSLNGLGLSRTVSRMLASTPEMIGEAIAQAGLAGGGWTALRLGALMRRRHEEVRRVFDSVDRIVVLSDWVQRLLRTNGVPETRLFRSPHGVERTTTATRAAWDARYVRLAHLGRLDVNKGTRLLIAALRGLPDAPITLDIFGITQSDADHRELDRLRELSGGDGRIRFLPAIDHGDIGSRLATFDAVVVPSQLLETGPLVVLESFAAGVPVIGSALGGIAEKVANGVNGLLVAPPDSVRAWQDMLHRCADDRGLLPGLRAAIEIPRSLDSAAADMHELYSAVLRERAVADAPTGRSR